MEQGVPGADPAHERLTHLLRTALPPMEDAPIEDETRRLMLHLSVEPPPVRHQPTPAAAPRQPLLRRLFARIARRRH